MAKFLKDFKVIGNKIINEDFFVLELSQSGKLPVLSPGQFVQAKIENSPNTFLRRPFSIHDVDLGKNTLKILIQVVGEGTKKLSQLEKGALLNLIYPLGNSFTMPALGEKILLIGGGCGIAPLLYLGRSLKMQGFSPEFLFGFRNSNRILEYSEYESLGKVWLTTEDGSAGIKGLVTDHPVLAKNSLDRIYCCGPEAMLKAVAKYCRNNNIFCEVTLENLMACGIGACLCCIVDTVKGNLCSCTDGPVFNINDLKW
jgi:dihydroorotate dehydrogenase electron transfer subunit